MALSIQWLVRWGCLAVIAVGVVLALISQVVPEWVRIQVKPAGYDAVIKLVQKERMDINLNETDSGSVTEAVANVGLWRWCIWIESRNGNYYSLCETPPERDFPIWWRGVQALAVIGLLMGALACVCGALEVYYSRRGVKFSGLAVLCAICCFVAAGSLGLSCGLFATNYIGRMSILLQFSQMPEPSGSVYFYPPVLVWSFGLNAAGGILIGGTGIILLAFITRTYPAYHRTQNVVV